MFKFFTESQKPNYAPVCAWSVVVKTNSPSFLMFLDHTKLEMGLNTGLEKTSHEYK